MFKRIALAGAIAISACGGNAATKSDPAPVARKPSIYDGAPDWVQQGSGAFGGERGKAFYGVGTASNINMESLRRATSDANARAEIAKIMNTYVANLMKQYQESASDGEKNQEVQMVTNTLKTFSQAQLQGVQIVKHWISNDGTTEFSLAQLDFSQFSDDMKKVNNLNDRAREVIKARSDQAFNELGAEEAKRANGGQ